jgi:ABC-type transport system involved in multi-copper enzyme maturation permease subunit
MRILALVVHTFREVAAKATLWVLAGISTLVLLVVALGFSTDSTADGTVLMFFGHPTSPPLEQAQVEHAVALMQAGLAGGLMTGVFLFGIFATAGIIPEALEKGIVDLYLSKPIARWELLAGKSLGAVSVILANIVYFIGALWAVVGFKAGIWSLQLLVSSLLMSFVFACLYSMVTFLAVLSRNMGIVIIGAFLYLIVIGAALESRAHGLYLLSGSGAYRSMIDGLFYLFPQISGMQNQIASWILKQEVDWVPFAQSLVSSCAIFAAAAALLQRKDF